MSGSEERTRPTAGPVLGRTTPGSEPVPVAAAAPADSGKAGRERRPRRSPAALAALVAGLTVGILVAVFAAQNSQGVAVHFLGYSTQSAPQFVVILLSVVLGLLIGFLLGLVGRRRRP
ncbi:MAG: lipopolysaccharide assembly protein LapA domain-containing protein [Candidatus Dormibacteria bacterium]